MPKRRKGKREEDAAVGTETRVIDLAGAETDDGEVDRKDARGSIAAKLECRGRRVGSVRGREGERENQGRRREQKRADGSTCEAATRKALADRRTSRNAGRHGLSRASCK